MRTAIYAAASTPEIRQIGGPRNLHIHPFSLIKSCGSPPQLSAHHPLRQCDPCEKLLRDGALSQKPSCLTSLPQEILELQLRPRCPERWLLHQELVLEHF